MRERLFVYGTLRKDSPQPMAKLLVKNSRFLGTAFTQGALYDLGRYPGMILSDKPDHITYGELFELTDPEKVLNSLDEYEECSKNYPKPTLYERKCCLVTHGEGTSAEAWCYVYNRHVDGHILVPDGNYLTYLENKEKGDQVHRFMESDWQAFRTIRLKALASNPEVFLSTLAKEDAFDDLYWQDYLKGNNAVFCLGGTNMPYGMAGIYNGDGTGHIWGVWITPEKRQEGQSGLLLEACKNWAENHPDIYRIAASARISNKASLQMLKCIGMRKQDSTEIIWPDGTTETMVNLSVELRA
ncbi:MAG: GNAT family N-acetyltransferase [Sneathiellales bacterium]|nr:GNAT family N-acetyltransferase [Sneathiellales bacterium]